MNKQISNICSLENENTIENIFPQPSDQKYTKWSIPSIALPDGAHNYEKGLLLLAQLCFKDHIYFLIPPDLNNGSTLYGIALFRQVMSSPLYSFIASRLNELLQHMFDVDGFELPAVERAYHQLTRSIDPLLADKDLYNGALYHNQSAANFVRVYGRNALVIFKAYLLETRLLFDGDSAGWLSDWCLTLAGLIPGLLESVEPVLSDKPEQSSTIPSTSTSDRPRSVTIRVRDTRRKPSVVNSPSNQGSDRSCDCQGVDNNNKYLTFPSSFSKSRSPSSTMSNTLLQSPVESPTLLSSTLPRRNTTATATSSENARLIDISRVNNNYSYKRVNTPRSAGVTQSMSNVVEFSSPTSACAPLQPIHTAEPGFPLNILDPSKHLLFYIPLGLLDRLLELRTPDTSVDKPTFLSSSSFNVKTFLGGATNPMIRTNQKLASINVTSLSPYASDPYHNKIPSVQDLIVETVPLTASRSSGSHHSSSSSLNSFDAAAGKGSLSSRSKKGQVVRPTDSSILSLSLDLQPSPISLARTLQLTRQDQTFVDNLGRTASTWFAARHALSLFPVRRTPSSYSSCSISSCPTSSLLVDDGDRQYGDDSTNLGSPLDSAKLDLLSDSHRIVLLKYPTRALLDRWIRCQFMTYLRSLILATLGYCETSADFYQPFVNCIRATDWFITWRIKRELDAKRDATVSSHLRPPKPSLISPPLSLLSVNQTYVYTRDTNDANASGCQSVAQTAHDSSFCAYSNPLSSDFDQSGIRSRSQHPGRRLVSSDLDDSQQASSSADLPPLVSSLVNSLRSGYKRFSRQGRQLLDQGMSKWSSSSSCDKPSPTTTQSQSPRVSRQGGIFELDSMLDSEE